MTEQLPPAEELEPVKPLTFAEARTELALLAIAYRENTMDLDEWCLGVHTTMAGYIAGTAQTAPLIRGASGAAAGKPPKGPGVRAGEASAAEPSTTPRDAAANRSDNAKGDGK